MRPLALDDLTPAQRVALEFGLAKLMRGLDPEHPMPKRLRTTGPRARSRRTVIPAAVNPGVRSRA